MLEIIHLWSEAILGEYSELLQNAFADIEQLKKTITNVSNEHDCTFQEAHKRIHFTPIWEKAVERLKQRREACFPDKPLVPTLERGN